MDPTKLPSIFEVAPEEASSNSPPFPDILRCAVCADSAHCRMQGIPCCNSCRNFFRREVYKKQSGRCPNEGTCSYQKGDPNRCHLCRFNRCLAVGLKPDLVLTNRQRAQKCREQLAAGRRLLPTRSAIILASKESNSPEDSSSSSCSTRDHLKQAMTSQVEQLFAWAFTIGPFLQLDLEEQYILLSAAWNELILAHLAYDTSVSSSSPSVLLVFSNGCPLGRTSAKEVGLGAEVFDELLEGLVSRMKMLHVDEIEVSYLRAMALMNPASIDLHAVQHRFIIDQYNLGLSSALEERCTSLYPGDRCRSGRLMLLLSMLRSLSLQCRGPLFVGHIAPEISFDTFIRQRLEHESAYRQKINEPF